MRHRHPASARADAPRPRLVLVEGASRSENLYFHHGSALFLCALVMTGDRDVAVVTAADALIMVGLDADWADDVAAVRTRRRLAGLVHARCRDHQPSTSMEWADLPPSIGVLAMSMADTARLQREVLALCVYGGHSADQAASVLGITTDDAYCLLRWGLKDVASGPH